MTRKDAIAELHPTWTADEISKYEDEIEEESAEDAAEEGVADVL